MTEEPYRWLEAIGNRREYVREQLKNGSPVFSASLEEGILLVGVGTGQSKVFELFDHHAMAGLGHPADLERTRQAVIDAAHLEAFTRAPEDVTLRRLIGHGLSAQLKLAFEQLFSAPYLIELLFAEVAGERERDVFVRLHFDGSFDIRHGGVVVVAPTPNLEASAGAWLEAEKVADRSRSGAAELLLQAWWCISQGQFDPQQPPPEEDRRAGWREATASKTIEIGWLDRDPNVRCRYRPLTLDDLDLAGKRDPS